MTGPEHYARAEALLDSVQNKNRADVDDEGRTVESYDAEDDPNMPEILAAAQVHATLALTAATVEALGRSLGSSLLTPVPDPDVPWPGGTAQPSPWGQVLL